MALPSLPLCCSLQKALTLNPVPVIGNKIYIPGAEGLNLRELRVDAIQLCCSHVYSVRNILDMLLAHASNDAGQSKSCVSQPVERDFVTGSDEDGRPTGRSVDGTLIYKRSRACFWGQVLWAYEMEAVVEAYKWIIKNRSRFHQGCSETATVVYQLRTHNGLPPGLYVYGRPLSYPNCPSERPLVVIDQFNLSATRDNLPASISISVFPGKEHYSAMYVIHRKLVMSDSEYGNRVFGEAKALDIIDASHGVKRCEHHQIALRTEQIFVVDLRWKSFDTKSACLSAVPKLRGLQAVIWSNHISNTQEVECKVLAWLFGLSNELPGEVQLIDHRHEKLGLRYILLEMDTFCESLPKPPGIQDSFFLPTYFAGDMILAKSATGNLKRSRSRMGSPCHKEVAFESWYVLSDLADCEPTPFSCGTLLDKSLCPVLSNTLRDSILQWSHMKNGTECLGLAVQHTLYYHGVEKRYKLMVTHTVMDTDNTLSIFRL